jgi:hypothetical protein
MKLLLLLIESFLQSECWIQLSDACLNDCFSDLLWLKQDGQ